MTTPTLVEIVARAICIAEKRDPDELVWHYPGGMGEPPEPFGSAFDRIIYDGEPERFLAALHDAGMVVVPRSWLIETGRILDHMGGEGLVVGSVDAADLFIELAGVFGFHDAADFSAMITAGQEGATNQPPPTPSPSSPAR